MATDEFEIPRDVASGKRAMAAAELEAIWRPSPDFIGPVGPPMLLRQWREAMTDSGEMRLGRGLGLSDHLQQKELLDAINGLKGEIDRLEAQLTELAVKIEARGKLIDQIAVGLGIDINAPTS